MLCSEKSGEGVIGGCISGRRSIRTFDSLAFFGRGTKDVKDEKEEKEPTTNKASKNKGLLLQVFFLHAADFTGALSYWINCLKDESKCAIIKFVFFTSYKNGLGASSLRCKKDNHFECFYVTLRCEDDHDFRASQKYAIHKVCMVKV